MERPRHARDREAQQAAHTSTYSCTVHTLRTTFSLMESRVASVGVSSRPFDRTETASAQRQAPTSAPRLSASLAIVGEAGYV